MYLVQLILAEPIPLQVKPEPMSYNLYANLDHNSNTRSIANNFWLGLIPCSDPVITWFPQPSNIFIRTGSHPNSSTAAMYRFIRNCRRALCGDELFFTIHKSFYHRWNIERVSLIPSTCPWKVFSRTTFHSSTYSKTHDYEPVCDAHCSVPHSCPSYSRCKSLLSNFSPRFFGELIPKRMLPRSLNV